MGIACWGGVSPKGVAGTEAWAIWPTLGPGHLPLKATEKDPLQWAQQLQQTS